MRPQPSTSVTRNDGSTGFESDPIFDTDYAGIAHKDDALFDATSDDDAYLIDTGH